MPLSLVNDMQICEVEIAQQMAIHSGRDKYMTVAKLSGHRICK